MYHPSYYKKGPQKSKFKITEKNKWLRIGKQSSFNPLGFFALFHYVRVSPRDHSSRIYTLLKYGIKKDKNTGVGCHSLLWGIFLTQGTNPDLLHCRWVFYRLSHEGSPLEKSSKKRSCPHSRCPERAWTLPQASHWVPLTPTLTIC